MLEFDLETLKKAMWFYTARLRILRNHIITQNQAANDPLSYFLRLKTFDDCLVRKS